MKKVFALFCVLCALVFSSQSAMANNPKRVYCRIESSDFKNNDKIWIDLGRENKEEAKRLEKEYKSMIDLLNHLGQDGWEIVEIFKSERGIYISEIYILTKEVE